MRSSTTRNPAVSLAQRHVTPRLKAYQVAYQACDFTGRLYSVMNTVIGKVGSDAVYLHSLERLTARFSWLQEASLHPPSLDHFDALYNALSVQPGDIAERAQQAIRIEMAQCIRSLIGLNLATALMDKVQLDTSCLQTEEPREHGGQTL